MPRRRSALYRLEAYGLQNEWNLWGLASGDLTDLCRACDGRGVEIHRPCGCTERPTARPAWMCPECTRAEGCDCCRRRCSMCHGRRVTPERVLAEDFGDRESLAIARSLFDVADGLEFYRKRIDMHAQLLG